MSLDVFTGVVMEATEPPEGVGGAALLSHDEASARGSTSAHTAADVQHGGSDQGALEERTPEVGDKEGGPIIMRGVLVGRVVQLNVTYRDTG